MSKQEYNLPGLTQLASFEAAARHLSFKDAAAELGVTSSAISHQIRALEDELSCHLFHRKRRKVEMTEQGQKLFDRLQKSFGEIDETVGEIRSVGAMNTAVVSTSPVFSTLWLSPRLPRYARSNPDYRVAQNSEGKKSTPIPPKLFITYGAAERDGFELAEIYRDELVPVASPAFAERYGHPNLPGLARLPLIDTNTTDPAVTRWVNWFRELDYLGDINFSKKELPYLEALQSAQSGAGVVLGWRNLLKPMLDRNELVVMSKYSLPAEESFFLNISKAEKLNPAEEKMREWLLNPKQQEAVFALAKD